MSWIKFITVALLAFSPSVLSTGPQVPTTNAARMAQGLPPLAPRFRSTFPGRNVPSRVQARDATTSGVPYTGCIQVTKKEGGALVGYVNKNFVHPLNRRIGITTVIANCLKVDLNTPRTGVFELTDVNPPSGVAAYPFLGWIASSTLVTPTLSINPSEIVVLSLTAHLDAGSVPTKVGNAYNNAASESTVWTFSDVTSQFSTRWVNPDGGIPATRIGYWPGSDALIQFGASPESIAQVYTDTYEVVFTLI